MESTLDLRQMVGVLRKHIWFIIISTLVFAVAAFGVATIGMTPKYSSTTQILVNRKTTNQGFEAQNQQADVQMVSTYKDIITNPVILKQAQHKLAHPEEIIHPAVKAKYGKNAAGKRKLIRAPKPAVMKTTGRSYNVSVGELKQAVSVTSQQNSQVFALTAESTDPDLSAAMANQVASVFKTKIKSMMSVNNVTIVSNATPSDQPTSPKTKLITLAGAVVGILIGLGYAFIKELTDTTVKDDDFLTDELGLINLGHVATIKKHGTNDFRLKNNHPDNTNTTPTDQHKRVRV
ncbi:YveK family protein [Secundilactobacillus silagei]|uniref:Capsular polysaccharide biosynthesis protein CpsC n=2 Tax=Secundilactobacillus silagei TaxID=1293415 RepID=A0A1Z5IFR5_9LACO|nr:Wzz/FepE/Etk N-terminal domain-containing protein [Secundilactobacillus silagei]TDG73264.1 hypothetical protein C5L25_000413 [Secundilactobacillus silagei JCM 19001]GAX00635.1 exopolysaccharide biosynthesis protein [Secundilactobacillus silagei JCM 19001]